MNRKNLISGLIAVVAVCCVFVAIAQSPIVKENKGIEAEIKWEYMVYPSSGRMTFRINEGNNSSAVEDFVKNMNKLGKDGWEIVEIGSFAVLKREVKEQQTQ